MKQYGVVIFHTTSAVMKVEKLLVKEGYSVKLIPTPRQFSSDCGIALRFNQDFFEQVRMKLNEAGIEYAAINRIEN